MSNNNKTEIHVGDIVTRRPVNNFSRDGGNGVVVRINSDGTCKIRWDKKASTGQQHSTIQQKFLLKINQ